MMLINDYIRFKRMQSGKTMLDIARDVGVSEATVSRWESGEIANMGRDKILLLAKSLSVSPLVLLLNEVTDADDAELEAERILTPNSIKDTPNIAKFTKLLKALPDEKVVALYRLALQALEL